MPSTVTDPATWDFAPVFDLLHSLGSQEGINNALDEPKFGSASESQQELTSSIQPTLGNFNRLWDYLGVQQDQQTAAPAVHFESSAKLVDASKNDAYASDGAIRTSSLANQRGWKSEGDHNPLDLTDSPTDGLSAPALTKTQRKKRNRKLRAAAAKAAKPLPVSDHEGDADDDEEDAPVPTQHGDSKRALKASKHARNISQSENKKPTAAIKKQPQDGTYVVPQATPQTIQEARSKVAAATAAAATSASGTKSDDSKPRNSTTTRPNSTSAKTIHESLTKQWPSTPKFNSTQYGLDTPAKQLEQPLHDKSKTQANAFKPPIPFPVIETKPPTRLRHEILPLVNQTSVERNWSLLLKLLHNFPEDRKHLVSPLQLSINRPQSNGIHVFVDASNILIGFYDHLKISRGIPKETKVPRVDLNFHALALLLERRRPVAKRVLAGSMPEIPAYEEARQVGYETCILDKVFKVKELTEKQKRIKSRELHASGAGYVSGSDSAGNGNRHSHDMPPQEAKWVEQAVDEILHLKILESVVDTPIAPDAVSPYTTLDKAAKDHSASSLPPTRPTMVLATGDAAEAEYSPGFRKMVERALRSGWMVEVMAFGRSVSRDYHRMAKTQLARGGWGERFKIIELDSYAEELFGEEL